MFSKGTLEACPTEQANWDATQKPEDHTDVHRKSEHRLLCMRSGANSAFGRDELSKADQIKTVEATVRLINVKKDYVGAGVIVSKVGTVAYVLTAAHIADGVDTLDVKIFANKTYPKAEHVYLKVPVIARRTENNQDLALLRIAGYTGESAGLKICPLPAAPKQAVPAASPPAAATRTADDPPGADPRQRAGGQGERPDQGAFLVQQTGAGRWRIGRPSGGQTGPTARYLQRRRGRAGILLPPRTHSRFLSPSRPGLSARQRTVTFARWKASFTRPSKPCRAGSVSEGRQALRLHFSLGKSGPRGAWFLRRIPCKKLNR